VLATFIPTRPPRILELRDKCSRDNGPDCKNGGSEGRDGNDNEEGGPGKGEPGTEGPGKADGGLGNAGGGPGNADGGPGNGGPGNGGHGNGPGNGGPGNGGPGNGGPGNGEPRTSDVGKSSSDRPPSQPSTPTTQSTISSSTSKSLALSIQTLPFTYVHSNKSGSSVPPPSATNTSVTGGQPNAVDVPASTSLSTSTSLVISHYTFVYSLINRFVGTNINIPTIYTNSLSSW
jgi:hypothetical protein